MFKGKATSSPGLNWLKFGLFLTLILLPVLASAVVRDYYFRLLDSRQGLTQSTITALMQDRDGFVWVGTQGELHRFDGYTFQNLEDILGKPSKLPSFARALAQNEDGLIYVGTLQDGLYQIDVAARRLSPVLAEPKERAMPNGRIDSLLYQPGVGLWIAWEHGIGRIDAANKKYREVFAFGSQSTRAPNNPVNVVRSMALDAHGTLWVASGHGLYQVNTATARAERHSIHSVNALLLEKSGQLIAAGPLGVKRITADKKEHIWPPEDFSISGGAACCDVLAMAQDMEGYIWLSVRNGNVWRLNLGTGHAESIETNAWVDGMLPEFGLNRMMIDRSNLLWLGGNTRGLVTTPARATPFRAVFDRNPARDPISGNFILSSWEGSSGEIWLGTLDGLRVFDPLSKKIESFNAIFAQAASELSGPGEKLFVMGITGKSDDQLWLATSHGLFHFDIQERIARRLPLLNGELKVPLRSMTQSRDGMLWIGYADEGFIRYDPYSGTTTHYPPRLGVDGAHQQTRVMNISEDSRGRLWIGGTLGLSLLDPTTGVFRNFMHDSTRSDSLSSNIVRMIFESRDGAIWIAGHHGLDQVVESATNEIRFRAWKFTGKNTRPLVYGVAEDPSGKLWISSNDGILRLDRSDESQINFGLSSGLQDLEFNGGVARTLRNGELLFGGIQGFNLVDTTRVQLSQFDAQVVLMGVSIGRAAPTYAVSEKEGVSLPHSQRVLSFYFSALDYTAPETNVFSYQLEGFDANFSAPAALARATYTNLPPGRYVFRVKAANADGVWSKHELVVPVHVITPWWMTPWAYAVYALLGFAAISLAWYLQRKRIAHRANLLAQIREREERLKLSLWGAGDSFWDLNLRDGHIYRIGADHLLNMTQDRTRISIDEWRARAIHPEDLPRVLEQMQAHLDSEKDTFEAEYRLRGAYDEWVWVRVRGKVVERDEKFNPVRVAGTARDITASRHADRERRIASEVLRSMNEAVAVIDLNFRFVSVNPAFSRITGYQEQDVVGMSDSLLDSSQHPQEFYRHAHDELNKKGHYKGEMWLRRADGEEFLGWVEQVEVRDEAGVRSHFVSVVNDITDKKRAEQELRYLANYDTLTGLPNRSLLSERLARAVVRARRQESRVAVLFLDLDHFKDINDSLGHAAGDRILKSSAARLLGVVGTDDTVARLGGDEFTIVMEGVSDTASIVAMAEGVIAAFGEPILIDGHGDIVISPSIGVSIYPEHALVPTDLLKYADAAMYRAKERGRNTFQIYDESMDAEVRQRATMTAALRRAIDRNEFHLVFQPRQSLRDGRITGVEALLRWSCEEFGNVSPATFIPLAEETGLILTIGEWVLEEACRVAAQWREQGLIDIDVAVNVSLLQLLRGDLPVSVARALAVTGFPATHLELELTETMVMANAEQTISILRDLKRIGITIAIDDFGTGYSSLVYLKRLPIDTLKIDKEFVGDLTRDPDDEAITTTIISMAHSLGLNVVAEGVETPEQLRFLREQSCDEIQGYLLSRPMKAEDCLEFLRQYQPEGHRAPIGLTLLETPPIVP